jgi:two-component system, cell cycle response regulator
MKVVIAEDEPVSRLVLQRAVEREGHTCVVAAGGPQAWDLYQVERPDVVISDWMMPGMDGIELLSRVREAMALDYTYLIVLTGLGDTESFETAMRAGADDFLTKPLDRLQLESRLKVAQRVTSLYRRLSEQTDELERLNQELFAQARRDPLTMLGNRLRLNEDLAVQHARMQRYGHAYCVALIDVDYLKRYNDTYGHAAGDAILQAVAATLSSVSRSGDVAYRYGGEEFLVIFPEQNLQSALTAADKLRTEVERLAIPHTASEAGDVVTISVGLACIGPPADTSVDTLLSRADEALYRSKRDGRNRVSGFDFTAANR